MNILTAALKDAEKQLAINIIAQQSEVDAAELKTAKLLLQLQGSCYTLRQNFTYLSKCEATLASMKSAYQRWFDKPFNADDWKS
jgi:hypothetical protein